MRLETVGMRTWLLATVAGAAVATYGLALLGLGGRIAPAGDAADPSLSAQVAHLKDAPPERLGQVDQYAAIAGRSVFSSDRSAQDFRLVSEVSPAQAVDVRLTGVLITPGMRMATLQTSAGDSLRLRQGGADVGGWRLLSLEPRAAVVEGPGGTRNLELQVESGSHDVGIAASPAMPLSRTAGSQPAAGQKVAGARAADAASAVPPTPTVPAPAGTTQERIEAIRQQIEARRRQLQQGQGGAPESNP